MSAYEDDNEDMFEEYQRYVRVNPGIPEDYDTWLQTETAGQRRKSRKPKPKKFTDFGD
jgi:hypothetical protein